MRTAAKEIAGIMSGSVIRSRMLGHPLTSLPAYSSRGFTVRRKAIVRSMAIGVNAVVRTNTQPDSPKNSKEIFCDQNSGKTAPSDPVRPEWKTKPRPRHKEEEEAE